jgi:mono/diheme cytochrome c family protein
MKTLILRPKSIRCLALAAGIGLCATLTTARATEPAAPPTRGKRAAASDDAHATYLRDIQPIFMGKCLRCHNDQSTLPNWLDYKTAASKRAEIKRRVWDSWKGHYYKQPMPAGNSTESHAMTDAERSLIKDWVENGANLGTPASENPTRTKAERMAKGEHVFKAVCSLCHQASGTGIPEKFPPLAGSDYLNADKERAIRTLLHGRQGEITVNGRKFNNSMPSFPLGDDDIASALTFVYNSFGNSGKDVTADEVKTLRSENYVPETPSTAPVASAPSQFE